MNLCIDQLSLCNFDLIVLNQDISNVPHFETLFHKARLRICADGGYDRLKDGMTPDYVIGDMDSVRRSTKGVKVIADSDQNSTDLDKCIKWCNSELIVAVGGLSGRLDHTLANINSAYLHPNRLILIDEANLCIALSPQAEHHIDCGKHTMVGVVPLASPIHCTTKGLKYEMEKTRLCFGEIISTSNEGQVFDLFFTGPAPALFTCEHKWLGSPQRK